MPERREAGYRHSKYYEKVLRRLNSSYKLGGDAAFGSLSELKFAWKNIELGFDWAENYAAVDIGAAELCSLYPNAGTYIIHLLLPLPTRIRWLEAGAEAAKNIGDARLKSFHSNNLGEAHYFAGQPKLAREFYLQALSLNRRLEDRRNSAQALGNLGVVSAALGESETAKIYLGEALSIFQETGDSRGEATALGDLGNLHKNEGNLDEALNFYRKRLEISRRIEEPRSEAQALNSIGSIYAEKRDFVGALQFHQDSLAAARRINDRRLQCNAHGRIGTARKNLGELDYAIASFRQQLKFASDVGYRRGEGSALWNIALVLYQSGDTAEAIDYAEKALSIYESLELSMAVEIRAQITMWRK